MAALQIKIQEFSEVEFNNELITNVLIAENEEFHIFEDGISLNQSFSLLPDSQEVKAGSVEYTSFNPNIATVGKYTGIVTPVKVSMVQL